MELLPEAVVNRLAPLGSTMANLAETVAAWRRGNERKMRIVEDLDGRYVQVLVTASGHVVCEVVSNNFLAEDLAWSDEETAAICALGFTAPSSTELDNHCNFHFDSEAPDAAYQTSRMMLAALLGPFALTRHSAIRVVV